jgi:flagellar biogenesis protein FliO
MFTMDQLTELIAYALAFVLLLWLASYLFRRSRESASDDLGHSIKILSQKVVNLNPRQRLIVVETMGHTLVVGACDRGGLSPIAHLSTPNGPIGSPVPHIMNSTPDLSGFDQMNSDSRNSYDQYYRDSEYDLRDEDHYQHSSMDAPNPRVDFEESTFVGEDSFTVEVPSVNSVVDDPHSLDLMANVDSYSGSQYPVSSSARSDDARYDTASRASDSDSEASGFSIASEEDDANMKPENLLQLIQKLNGSKG